MNIDAIRQDFPFLQRPHQSGRPLVYLDSTATSQKPRQVIDALVAYYSGYNANVHRGIYEISELATEAYEGARKKVRKFINARSKREIIFTRGTTEAINLVANTWGRVNLRAGDVVLSTVMEHHSNIVPWQMIAEQTGAEVRFVPITPDGLLDLDAYRALLRDFPVKLVAVGHVSNVLGTINPLNVIIPLAHEHGALVLVDGAQSVPHMPVDVQGLDADFLAFSGHKMLAPMGSGALYGKLDLLDAMPPWMGGGDMISSVTVCGSTWNELPYKFEAGTPSVAEAVGLGVAIDYLTALGMDNVRAHEQEIAAYALERLAELPELRIIGTQDATKRGGVIAFTFGKLHPHDLAQILDAQAIAVRAGFHCAQPLHEQFNISASTRASFYVYTNRAEIDALVQALAAIHERFTT
jgi:cysteine desulfurase/selenocysteine lyase